MKKILLSLLITASYFGSFAQMRTNGKLNDIRNATMQNVMEAIEGEYQKNEYRSNIAIKFDKNGNFKMVYEHKTPDEYQSVGGTTSAAYYVSGKYQLLDANYSRFNNLGNVQTTNRYGQPINDIIYTRFYIVLIGKDDQGISHTMCGEVSQPIEENEMFGWTINSMNKYSKVVESCSCNCEIGDKLSEIRLPLNIQLK